MAKPPQITKLTVEQLANLKPEEQLEKVIAPLNGLVDGSSANLSQGLTFAENFSGKVHDLDIDMPASPWIAPTLLNSWVNFGSGRVEAGYRKFPDGRVEIRGAVKNGASPTSTMFTLPAGYRPSNRLDFPAIYNDVSAAGIKVDSDGVVAAVFAAGTTMVNINCCFTPSDMTPVAASPFPCHFSWKLSAPPKMIWIGSCKDRENGANLSLSPLALDWEFTTKDGGGSVKVRNVPGLQYGRKYRLTLIAVTG